MGNYNHLYRVLVLGLTLAVLGAGCQGGPAAPALTSTPTPVQPTPEESTPPTLTEAKEFEFRPVANPVAGFSISYPADWVYSADEEQSYFAENDEVLRTGMPKDGAMFLVMSQSVRELEPQLTTEVTADSIFNWVALNLFRNRGALIGETSPRSFGTDVGVGAQVMWVDRETSSRIQAYMTAVETAGMATVTLAMAVDTEWNGVWPIFEAMLDSMRLSAPYVYDSVERGEIEAGEHAEGELTAGWSDQWTFTSSGDEYISVSVAAVGHRWDPYVEIYTDDGRLLADDDNGAEGYDAHLGAIWLASRGTYTIYVSGYTGAGLYEIAVARVDPQVGGIEYGEMVTAEIAELTEWDVWTFQGQAGDVVELAMKPVPSGLDCLIDLYDPAGSIVAAGDPATSVDAIISGVPLPMDGLYRVAARSTNDTVGGYELSIARLEAEGGGTIEYRETVAGTILPSQSQEWTFEGKSGDLVTLSMGALEGELDSLLTLRHPDGTELAADDNSGRVRNALIEGFFLPVTGSYTAVASAGPAVGGRYWLRVEPTPVEGTLAYGDTVSATVTPGGRDNWLFDGEAGEVIRITVIGTGDETLDGYLELFTLGAELLASDDDTLDGRNPQIDSFRLPRSGTYRISVMGYLEEDQGDYELALSLVDQ
jgi:hypothetical protein